VSRHLVGDINHSAGLADLGKLLLIKPYHLPTTYVSTIRLRLDFEIQLHHAGKVLIEISFAISKPGVYGLSQFGRFWPASRITSGVLLEVEQIVGPALDLRQR
jgi:hypothetical protein